MDNFNNKQVIKREINFMINNVIRKLLKQNLEYKHWILVDFYYYDKNTFHLILENPRDKKRKDIQYTLDSKVIEIKNHMILKEYCFLDCENLEYY